MELILAYLKTHKMPLQSLHWGNTYTSTPKITWSISSSTYQEPRSLELVSAYIRRENLKRMILVA